MPTPLKTGCSQGFDHLLAGGSRKFQILALLVFRGTETSTGIGLPSFLANLDVSRDRLFDLCQRLFPGSPFADAPRKGRHRHGVPSILIRLHKDGIAETSIWQIDPSTGELSTAL